MKDKLYKYRSLDIVYDEKGNVLYDGVERCIDIIENHRLYFPIYNNLNDPYEGVATPIQLGILGESIYRSMGFLHPTLEGKMEKYRVLSMSATPISMQMWAHYANNYKGVCIEFSTNGFLKNAERVKYIEKPFDLVFEPEPDELKEIIYNNFFYKSKNWDYEQEYRIVKKTDKEFVVFERKEITGIILGNRGINSEGYNKIKEVAKKYNIPVYYSLFTPTEYKLSIVTQEEVSDLGNMILDDIRYK